MLGEDCLWKVWRSHVHVVHRHVCKDPAIIVAGVYWGGLVVVHQRDEEDSLKNHWALYSMEKGTSILLAECLIS